jgi:nucleoside-diphosphate-sugar epimerase
MTINEGPGRAKLIVGCGYLGQRIARRWHAQGDSVWAMTRSEERAREFERAGWRPIVADVLDTASLAQVPPVATVVYAVGYDRRSNRSIEEMYVAGLGNVLAALDERVQRVIYVSSTGVYGGAGGAWVDEETPCEPERAGGRACLAAERLLAESRWHARSVVLRMAGIYGPARLPRSAEIVRGEPIPAPAQGALNLIHVEDGARVVLAAEERAPVPRLYCVSDGQAAGRHAYYEELARLLGAPPPVFVEPPPESPVAERAASDKRVGNARMIRELGVRLEFPSFREGLAQSVQG